MNVKVKAVVARNSDPLTEVDFSSEQWIKWQNKMIPEGIDLQHLLPSMLHRYEVDAENCIYWVWVDGRCIRNMWLRCADDLMDIPQGGAWIPDTVIPELEWQCPSPGGDRYWWISDDLFTIGIHLHDLRESSDG